MLKTKFDQVLDFPCVFSCIIIGSADIDFTEELIKKAKEITKNDFCQIKKSKTSSKGSYASFVLKIKTANAKEIEKLYEETAKIKGIERVI